MLFDHHNDYRDTFVLKLNVFMKTNLECCLIITMITGIFVTFMFRLNVVLKNPLVCSFIITVITRIFVMFMFRLNMFLKTTLVCCLIITITTRLFATFMFRLNMCIVGTTSCSSSAQVSGLRESLLRLQTGEEKQGALLVIFYSRALKN